MSGKRYQYLPGEQPTEVMRMRADWMRAVDDPILEYLRDEGAGTPKSIGDALDKNNNYIGDRCRALTSYGLLRRPSRGLYMLADEGSQYLDEELDASELTRAED